MHRSNPTTITAAAVLAASVTVGLVFIRYADVRYLSYVGAIIASALYASERICRTIRSVNRPADDAYNEGHESGYDKGWRDGRRTSRPTVVRFPPIRVAPAAVSLSRDSAGI